MKVRNINFCHICTREDSKEYFDDNPDIGLIVNVENGIVCIPCDKEMRKHTTPVPDEMKARDLTSAEKQRVLFREMEAQIARLKRQLATVQ